MKNIAWSLRNNSLTVVIDGKVSSVDSKHPNWDNILEALRNENSKLILELMDIRKSVIKFVDGKLRIEGNECWFGDVRVGGVVVDRLLEFIGKKLPHQPLMRFIENLYANPSKRAVTELYSFLENRNMPINNSGNFIAYKGVRSDFYSITSGKLTLLQGKAEAQGHIYNGVGETIECKRNEVDDDATNTCSTGIHAGSLDYATGFAGAGGKVVLVEINPKDCVSVPIDHDAQKLRTSKYKVIGEFTIPLDNTYVASTDDDENEFGSDDTTEYDTGYADGYADGCEADVEIDESGIPIDYEEEYDRGYNDGYVDGYAGGKVITNVKNGTTKGLVVSEYNSGYSNGRRDSRTHSKDIITGFSLSYQIGYADGYGHKAKQVK